MTEKISKTRLQAERQKQQWTQEEIAENLGVDVKTVSRWERGEQVAISQMRRKLSKLFGTEVDSSWFLRSEMLEGVSASFWQVPYDRNPYFTDDCQRVEHLRALLTAEGKETPHITISGLGGIGKTQLALEYAYRYRDNYKVIFWVRASTQAQLVEDMVGIAHLLQLSRTKKREEKQEYLVNQVLHWLQVQNGWLLILDNVEEDLDNDDVSIARLLSTLKNGHILLTTRVQSIANLTPNLLLGNLSPEEGAQFLLRRSHCFPSPDTLQVQETAQYEDARGLARLLDGLPLALEQAAAYIQETGYSLAGYKHLYEISRKDVLQTKVTYKRLYTDYSESVATTWLISFRRVEQQSAVASDLLKLFAYLAPDVISTHMILKGAEKLDADLHALTDNDYAFNAACQILLNYSLIKRFAEGTLLSIHRLIQAVLQDSMEGETRRLWEERAVCMVDWSLTNASAKEVEHYLPHACLCAAFIKKHALQSQEAAHLLEKTAKTVYQQGWYAQARPLYLSAYDAVLDLLGREDPHSLSLLLDVARVHMDLDVTSFAAQIYRWASQQLESKFGPTYPEVINCLNNLTEAQLHMGALDAAERTYQDTLSRYTQEKAFDIAQQARTYSLAALIAERKGWRDRAESYYRTALDLKKQAFGSDHLEAARGATDLGLFYLVYYKDHNRATPLLRGALETRQKILGQIHPDIAESLVALAMLSWDQRNYPEAEHLYQQALTIRQQQLGLYHPGVLHILHDLAVVAAEQHKDEEAEQYFHEMFAIAPHAVGTKSEHYLVVLKGYADFLQARKRDEEAAQYREQIVALSTQLTTRGSLNKRDLLQIIEGEENPSGPLFLW